MPYNIRPNKKQLAHTLTALATRGIQVQLADTKDQALEELRKLLPKGVELMTGGSTTLEQIGFTELLKNGQHPWNNVKDKLLAEKDPVKQSLLRRQATLADYYIGSVQAITETGQVLFASNTGSQIPAYAFSSPHVIWVAGTQKIVPTLEDGLKRIRDYCLPLEDQRMKKNGLPGSTIGKILIFERETSPRRSFQLILANEVLGF
ncbi:MAG: lactate utilization protein [Patescibacteria group bacterium]